MREFTRTLPWATCPKCRCAIDTPEEWKDVDKRIGAARSLKAHMKVCIGTHTPSAVRAPKRPRVRQRARPDPNTKLAEELVKGFMKWVNKR